MRMPVKWKYALNLMIAVMLIVALTCFGVTADAKVTASFVIRDIDTVNCTNFAWMQFPVSLRANGLRYPIDQSRLFGTKNEDGTVNRDIEIISSGIFPNDIYGQPVLAAYSGRIVEIYDESFYGDGSEDGNYVVIEHVVNQTRYYTKYTYLDEISSTIEVNMVVQTGKVIGTVGNTGNVPQMPVYSGDTSGARLGFAVYVEDYQHPENAENPEKYIQNETENPTGKLIGTFTGEHSTDNGCEMHVELYQSTAKSFDEKYVSRKPQYLYTGTNYYTGAYVYDVSTTPSGESFVISDIALGKGGVKPFILKISCESCGDEAIFVSLSIVNDAITYVTIPY